MLPGHGTPSSVRRCRVSQAADAAAQCDQPEPGTGLRDERKGGQAQAADGRDLADAAARHLPHDARRADRQAASHGGIPLPGECDCRHRSGSAVVSLDSGRQRRRYRHLGADGVPPARLQVCPVAPHEPRSGPHICGRADPGGYAGQGDRRHRASGRVVLGGSCGRGRRSAARQGYRGRVSRGTASRAGPRLGQLPRSARGGGRRRAVVGGGRSAHPHPPGATARSAFQCQAFVGGEFLAVADAWWQEACVAAEVDSRQWHLSPDDWEKTLARHTRMTSLGILVLHFPPAGRSPPRSGRRWRPRRAVCCRGSRRCRRDAGDRGVTSACAGAAGRRCCPGLSACLTARPA